MVLKLIVSFSFFPDDGEAVGDDTEQLEHNLLAMLGAEEWEGVAVGFLLAKVCTGFISLKSAQPPLLQGIVPIPARPVRQQLVVLLLRR